MTIICCIYYIYFWWFCVRIVVCILGFGYEKEILKYDLCRIRFWYTSTSFSRISVCSRNSSNDLISYINLCVYILYIYKLYLIHVCRYVFCYCIDDRKHKNRGRTWCKWIIGKYLTTKNHAMLKNKNVYNILYYKCIVRHTFSKYIDFTRE
jgi:hypothetical protein